MFWIINVLQKADQLWFKLKFPIHSTNILIFKSQNFDCKKKQFRGGYLQENNQVIYLQFSYLRETNYFSVGKESDNIGTLLLI